MRIKIEIGGYFYTFCFASFLGRGVSGDSVFMLPFANIIIKGINPNAKHRELCLSVDQKES